MLKMRIDPEKCDRDKNGALAPTFSKGIMWCPSWQEMIHLTAVILSVPTLRRKEVKNV